ncbi:hypothetical protein TNCV_87111 [Trichonephila clavipes]|nr:hypothetical protein TNCV_87111 [Trichonephila clavipes]
MRSLRQNKEGVIDTLCDRDDIISSKKLEHAFVHLKKNGTIPIIHFAARGHRRLNPRDAFLLEGPMELNFSLKDVRSTLISPVCILGFTNTVNILLAIPEIITKDFREFVSSFCLVKCKVFP